MSIFNYILDPYSIPTSGRQWLFYLPIILWVVFLICYRIYHHLYYTMRSSSTSKTEADGKDEGFGSEPLGKRWKLVLVGTVLAILLPAFITNLFSGVRHWMIGLPPEITLKKIEETYQPQLDRLKKLIKMNEKKEANLGKQRDVNGIRKEFDKPEILEAAYERSENGYRIIYQKKIMEKVDGGVSILQQEPSPGQPVINQWKARVEKKNLTKIVYRAVAKNQSGKPRTYYISFQADLLRKKLKE